MEENIKEYIENKYNTSLLYENNDYIVYLFYGCRVELNKKMPILTKLKHQIKIKEIHSTSDIDDFMEDIKKQCALEGENKW